MSNNTNAFEMVKEFHEKFEVQTPDTPYLEIFDDIGVLDLRMKLIKEEWEELQDAVANRDFIETIDALADILVVTIGFGDAIGVDLKKAFELVHTSNMSKLCDSEEHAQETVEWYKETRPQFQPSYRKTKDGQKWLVFDVLTGKVLKNKYYSAVDLTVLLPSSSTPSEDLS